MNSLAKPRLALSMPERDFLDQYQFDKVTFLQLQSSLSKGQFSTEQNTIDADLQPPSPADLVPWSQEKSLSQIGKDAINKGEVGIAVLNGGMATRFGGVVKGIVKVAGERSFLDLKFSDLTKWIAPTPVFVMNSFATEEATNTHLQENDYFGLPKERVHQLVQRISLRLTPEGELFRTSDHTPSFYAPGHGDIFEVLASSPALHRERERGLRYILVSNVDNLGANLSPAVIGAHILGKKPVTVEVAPRNPGDKGGAPAYVNGRLEIVEGFRFPPGFDHETLPVFNTNTFVFNTEVFDSTYPLTWFRADKTVENQGVIQFERLMGQITHFLDTNYLLVPRTGSSNRFMPIKTPRDLEVLAPIIKDRFT